MKLQFNILKPMKFIVKIDSGKHGVLMTLKDIAKEDNCIITFTTRKG